MSKTQDYEKKTLQYQINKAVFMNFLYYNQKFIQRCTDILRTEKRKAFIFGAHVTSQYMFNLGLTEKYIECIIDDDPDKTGYKLYGSNLFIESSDILKNYHSPIIIVRMAQYTDEIKKNIINNINPNVIFLE